MPADVHFDFSALLLLLTVVTGVVYLLDVLVLRKRRKREAQPGHVIEFSRSFFPIILIVLLLRSFLGEPFRIPSGSMIPTLEVGDFILVNKFAYGLRAPVFHTMLVPVGEPKRGDVAVFRYPRDPSKDFIKRVVGLPGDKLAYRGKVLYINGVRQALNPRGLYSSTDPRFQYATEYVEQLGDLEHAVLINPRRTSRGWTFTVPEGEYFVMGDNRDGSDDSRSWGTVPARNLVGRAKLIWMSWDGDANRPVLSRIGTMIQ